MSLRDGLTGFSNFLFPVLVGAPKGISFGHKPRPYILRDAYRGTRADTQAVPPHNDGDCHASLRTGSQ